MPNLIKPKDRMKMPRQLMPELDPVARGKNFEEVNLGFDPALAKAGECRDILSGQAISTGPRKSLNLEPYFACWLQID